MRLLFRAYRLGLFMSYADAARDIIREAEAHQIPIFRPQTGKPGTHHFGLMLPADTVATLRRLRMEGQGQSVAEVIRRILGEAQAAGLPLIRAMEAKVK